MPLTFAKNQTAYSRWRAIQIHLWLCFNNLCVIAVPASRQDGLHGFSMFDKVLKA
jgi:hypothetical protein